jgi:hypothetical protein
MLKIRGGIKSGSRSSPPRQLQKGGYNDDQKSYEENGGNMQVQKFLLMPFPLAFKTFRARLMLLPSSSPFFAAPAFSP